MSTPKITGLETEYGVTILGDRTVDPWVACRLLLAHCKNPPSVRKQQGRPDDLMLYNGARLYIDHGHPEYSTPECLGPLDLLAADKAGERVLCRAAARAKESGALAGDQEIRIYKNNSDQKGNSYGCHENYLISPETFAALGGATGTGALSAAALSTFVPFLVTRTLFCGAGKVGSENGAGTVGFQLSQRADFLETLRGPQTMWARPLLNTRDEPHADPARFRRLHVIAGDANVAEYSTYLKVATTQLVLRMIEDGCAGQSFALADPTTAARAVSRDLSLALPLPLEGGGRASALEIAIRIFDEVRRYVAEHGGEADEEVLRVWQNTLDKLHQSWSSASCRLDWAIKRRLLERYLERHEASWEDVRRWCPIIEATLSIEESDGSDGEPFRSAVRRRSPRAALFLDAHAGGDELSWKEYRLHRELYFGLRRLDLDYHDVRRGPEEGGTGIVPRLEAAGAVDRLLTDERIEQLVAVPPHGTRATVRGRCLMLHAERIEASDWGEITIAAAGGRPRRTILLIDPAGGTEDEVRNALVSIQSGRDGETR